MDPLDRYDTVSQALNTWGVDQEDISLINRRVMDLVFKHFNTNIISFEYDPERDALKLDLMVRSSNFCGELYYVVNKKEVGAQLACPYTMIAAARVFYAIFSVSSTKVGGRGTFFFGKGSNLNSPHYNRQITELRKIDDAMRRFSSASRRGEFGITFSRQNSVDATREDDRHSAEAAAVVEQEDISTRELATKAEEKPSKEEQVRRKMEQKAKLKPISGETTEEFDERVKAMVEKELKRIEAFEKRLAEARENVRMHMEREFSGAKGDSV